MSTPVRGGPQGPLGYAPRRTREQQGAAAGSAPPVENDPPRVDNPPPPRAAGGDSGSRTPSLREALRDTLSAAGGGAPSSLRQALSDHGGDLTERLDSLSAPRGIEPARIEPTLRAEPAPRSEPAPRKPAPPESAPREPAPRPDEPAQMREALSALERLTSRSAQLLRESQENPQRPLQARQPAPVEPPPVRSPERVRDRLRETLSGAPLITEEDLLPPGTRKRMTLPPLAPEPAVQNRAERSIPDLMAESLLGPQPVAPEPEPLAPPQPPEPPRPAAPKRAAAKAPPVKAAPAKVPPPVKAPPVKAPAAKAASAPRDLLDDGFDIEPPPRPRKEDRRRAVAAQAPPAARTPARPVSSGVFAGDAAMVALRSRLAGEVEEDFEAPAPVRTARLSPVTRFVGVVALAAGGAFGFLWITSPHQRPPAPIITDEVALIDLKAPDAAALPPALATDDAAPAGGNDGSAAPPPAPPPAVPQQRAGGGARGVNLNPVPSASLELVAPSAPAANDAAPASPASLTALGPAPGARDLLARANDLLQHGDVAAARLVLRRAAAGDNAQAALALAGTYDTRVLKTLGITTFNDADPVQARAWYRKAAALGSADASARLEQMERDHALQ